MRSETTNSRSAARGGLVERREPVDVPRIAAHDPDLGRSPEHLLDPRLHARFGEIPSGVPPRPVPR